MSVHLAFPSSLLEMHHMFPDEKAAAAFNSVLGIATWVEAPTYPALYSGEWTHPNQEKTPYG